MVQTIPCPNCQTAVAINTRLLIQGAQFTCAGCGGSIGIAPDSVPVVAQAMAKLEELEANPAGVKQERRA